MIQLLFIALSFFFGKVLKILVFRVLSFVGFGLIVFNGLEVLTGQLINLVNSHLPSQSAVFSMLNFLNVFDFISLILSAYISVLTYKFTKKIFGFRGQAALGV